MSWAISAVESLKNGETVTIKPAGNSMVPKINSKDVVTIEPVGDRELRKDDIVLAKINGKYYLHLIKGLGKKKFLIGNNKGHINRWTARKNIFGVATRVAKE